MTLQDQVTSLESSKKIKELGFPQSSLFYWRKYIDWIVELRTNNPGEYGWTDEEVSEISAFTASELGEMLPDNVKSYKDKRFPWTCEYVKDGFSYYCGGQTEVEAREKMLIHLASNGLMEVKK